VDDNKSRDLEGSGRVNMIESRDDNAPFTEAITTTLSSSFAVTMPANAMLSSGVMSKLMGVGAGMS